MSDSGLPTARERPDLTVSHDVPLKAGKCSHDFAEPYCWYGDFEMVVFAAGVAGEQLQRPPGSDVRQPLDIRCATLLRPRDYPI
jgi:hypothetical protein